MLGLSPKKINSQWQVLPSLGSKWKYWKLSVLFLYNTIRFPVFCVHNIFIIWQYYIKLDQLDLGELNDLGKLL